ncbi:polysaccharide deacetylase family protein [Haloferula sp.]|uniref:polysaccharide deacetylase family protein n=1 Tax=Haloferula sp. TaxID=2497595 RepID=UPI003C714202
MILRILSILLVLPVLMASAADESVRVSVLGYHDFSESDDETEMKIRTSKFRRQMEAIRDLGLNVISMEDFQAWKRGERSVPDKSIMITIDDGWKSVYDEAFPILKELGYPFTIFLYKSYVDGGGRALTTPMIKEMMEHGATIGSHSVSHPYPATVKKHRKEGPDAYDQFLRNEMGESKRFLESKFGKAVTSYAYPGGFQTQEMFTLGDEFGYGHLFTVLPGKVRRDTPDHSLPRYIILGTHDHIFELATAFNDTPGNPSRGSSDLVQTTPFPVQPEPGRMIDQRLPLISADLSDAGPIDPESVVMSVGGFGQVPATFDEETGTVSWQVNRHLRSPGLQVRISWKDPEGKAPEVPLRWNFNIDQEAAYVPQN